MESFQQPPGMTTPGVKIADNSVVLNKQVVFAFGKANTFLSIPSIVVGAWQLSAGHSDRSAAIQGNEEAAVALVAHADAGLFCFDCADIYQGVEDVLGEVIRRRPVGTIRVHTKASQ